MRIQGNVWRHIYRNTQRADVSKSACIDFRLRTLKLPKTRKTKTQQLTDMVAHLSNLCFPFLHDVF